MTTIPSTTITAVIAARRTSPNGWTVDFENGLTVLVLRMLATATLFTMRPVSSVTSELPALDHHVSAALQRRAIEAVCADLTPVRADIWGEDLCGNACARLVVQLEDVS